jgi:hypothetical protein
MPKLVNMRITEVSGVDRAANRRRFLLIKSEGGEAVDDITKNGKGPFCSLCKGGNCKDCPCAECDKKNCKGCSKTPLNKKGGGPACEDCPGGKCKGCDCKDCGKDDCKGCDSTPLGKAAAPTKTEDGQSYPAAAYAHVPDPSKPDTWKLRLWEDPDKKETPAQVGLAMAALEPKGLMGNKVKLPPGDLPGVKGKVKTAWQKTHPDAKDEDVPNVLKSTWGERFVDLVKGLFHGQDESEDVAVFDDLNKIGRTISAANLNSLKAAHGHLAAVIATAADNQGNGDEIDPGTDPDAASANTGTDENLDDEDALTNQGGDNVDKNEQVTKADFEALRKRNDDLESLLKVEQDARILKAFQDKVGIYKALPIGDGFASVLKGISEKAPTEYAELDKVLTAADEAMTKGALFSEIGRGGSAPSGAQPKIDTLAAEMVTKDTTGLTREQAIRKVYREHPDLYAELQREQAAARNRRGK